MSVEAALVNGAPVARTSYARPVQILFVIDQLCALGGAERVLLRILDALPRERFSPRLLTFKLNPDLRIADRIRCPLHLVPLRKTYDWSAVKAAREVRRIVQRYNIQITHTFHETSDLWAGPIAKLSGCPALISSRRDMGFNRAPKHHHAYRWLGRCFDQVHTVSDQVRRHHIQADRLDPERVLIIPNGIDLSPERVRAGSPGVSGPDSGSSVRARWGLPSDALLITSVGNIRRVKGFDVLLRAAARICAERTDVHFAIAGEELESDYAAELKNLVRALHLSRFVTFLGSVDGVRPLLNASDLFCLPSRTEGLSNALLEAMACSLPCVATEVGGNGDLIAGKGTGLLVPSEDHDALAESVLRVLRSPVEARAMGARARQLIEQDYTADAMMRKLMRSYEQLLERC